MFYLINPDTKRIHLDIDVDEFRSLLEGVRIYSLFKHFDSLDYYVHNTMKDCADDIMTYDIW